MKLAFIGIGKVGFALAHRLEKAGHEIIVAHDNPQSGSVLKAQAQNPNFTVAPVQKAIDQADAVFLAIPFFSVKDLLEGLHFQGKPLIDCTNPVGPGIKHGLESKISGAEKVAQWAVDAKVVKSYTIYGFENLEDASFPKSNVKPSMFIAGDDGESKDLVSTLNHALGFETLDVGGLNQSLHLEHMTLMWVKMVRVNGHSPNLTWAALSR